MHMALSAKEWTVDDLAALPDDGQRYEIIDGELFATPSPVLRHQDAVLELAILLAAYLCRERTGHVVVAPSDVTFSRKTVVEPDVFVMPLVAGRKPLRFEDAGRLLLAAEVLSPSTARVDRVRKRKLYRDQGVGEYWLIDLDARIIERSTPADDRLEVIEDTLSWSPEGAVTPLLIDVRAYFRDVLE
jgi:Uma2 family endonuclease